MINKFFCLFEFQISGVEQTEKERDVESKILDGPWTENVWAYLDDAQKCGDILRCVKNSKEL